MEVIFELLFQLIGEYVIAILFELLARGAGWLAAPWASTLREQSGVWTKGLRALLYAGGGVLCGWLSLQIMPESFARTLDTRLAVLIGVPLMCGASMAMIGYLRKNKGREVAAIESFGNGFLFALALSLMRFFHTT